MVAESAGFHALSCFFNPINSPKLEDISLDVIEDSKTYIHTGEAGTSDLCGFYLKERLIYI